MLGSRQIAAAMIITAIICASPLTAHAIGFKKPALPGGGPSKLEPIVTQIKDAHAVMTAGSIALSEARVAMLAATGNKEKAETYKAEIEQAKAIPDPKEKDAKLAEIEVRCKEDGAAALAVADSAQQASSAEAGEALGSSLTSLVGAIKNDVVALGQVKEIISSAPATVSEVKSGGAGAVASEGGNLKYVMSALTGDLPDMAVQIPAQVGEMYSFLAQARSFMTAKGIPVPESVAAQSDESFSQ